MPSGLWKSAIEMITLSRDVQYSIKENSLLTFSSVMNIIDPLKQGGKLKGLLERENYSLWEEQNSPVSLMAPGLHLM